MKVDIVKPLQSSFLSCGKDMRHILNQLFESSPYGADLKRLLVLQTDDCLIDTGDEIYNDAADLTVDELIEQGYIYLSPSNFLMNRSQVLPDGDTVTTKANWEMTPNADGSASYINNTNTEHNNYKSCINIYFDNFTMNGTNSYYRDNIIGFDIICHSNTWVLKDKELRPLKIAGYIDGILNNTKLSGIGTLQFLGCNQLILDNVFSGYTIMFAAIHGGDDVTENDPLEVE